MAIFKAIVNKLFNKGYELLKALGVSPCKIREPLKKIRNNRERESDFSRYLDDMYNYSIRYAYKK